MTETPSLLAATVPELLRQAQTCHAKQRLAEAEALYRQILDRQSDNVAALGLLALILVDRPNGAEAEAVILRHLALRPNDGASLHALGQLRARAGNDVEAVDLFERAARWLPNLAPIHNDLGASLNRLGRDLEALAVFDHAVALDPAYGAAHGNRGAVLLDLKRFDEALLAQLAALTHTPEAADQARASILDGLTRAARKAGRLDVAEVVLRGEITAGRNGADVIEQLSLVLDARGRNDEATALRNDLARRTGIQTGGPASAETIVLVLGAVGAGHVPIRYLLDTSVFATTSVSLLSPDQADAPLGSVDIEALRKADVIFSTLGDIDRGEGQFAAAADLCARIGIPVINPPQSILNTGRDEAAELFGDIPTLIAPLVSRMSPQALGDHPITAPLLVRPAGDHGGDNLVLLRDEAQKAAWLAEPTGERLLVSPFWNFRSVDGFWRKYRLIFVDRRVYAYHLAIGDNWLVHYWRTEMGRSEWKKAEEERFLTDWRSVFGPAAAAAVEAVASRLDLDYGGIDCSLMPDGKVLLFEANACMLLHLDETPQAFPYKHRNVPKIRDAFTRLARERAGSLSSAGQRVP